MPQDKPTQSDLSEPIEAEFLRVLMSVVEDSYKYGVEKYGTPLMTFNGRSELLDGAEELVSALRYFVQLDMKCKKLEKLLRQWVSGPVSKELLAESEKALSNA